MFFLVPNCGLLYLKDVLSIRESFSYIICGRGGGAVGYSVRLHQEEGLVFESELTQTLVIRTECDCSNVKRSPIGVSVFENEPHVTVGVARERTLTA